MWLNLVSLSSEKLHVNNAQGSSCGIRLFFSTEVHKTNNSILWVVPEIIPKHSSFVKTISHLFHEAFHRVILSIQNEEKNSRRLQIDLTCWFSKISLVAA